ncbi:N-acetylated-alpha-linked acidic dipeptidase 2 [Chionoecetes opilio]|uniref:N-acetylated-alpha-linked acidic dipeptidase 2 n=1 Tax=Chionoecetes opilio TaxID=41210 RepID=A0A8J4YSB4_CHIOP|nr:N-acetylated-alpha-linked acidic dipeptidase 2 [Chionoecetes opilio]
MASDVRCGLSSLLWGAGLVILVMVFAVIEVPSDVSRRGLQLRRDWISLTEVEGYVINGVNATNIRAFLRHLTLHPHLGGTEGEWQTAHWVADTWRQQGMDEVHLVPYEVLLSYPSTSMPNKVRLLDGSAREVWASAIKQKPLYAPEEFDPDLPFTFNGYAAAGNVTGPVVYAHYGGSKDFAFLAEAGVNVSGSIVLARYGKAFRANIAKMAEDQGARGLLLFSDPSDYAPEGPDFVYPHSYFMPPSAAPFGTTKLVDGDPLTPFYPAVESAFRIPEEEAAIPKIPIQPIGYNDAYQLLRELGGAKAPQRWQGGLNITYHLGPGFRESDWTVNLEVNNRNTMTTTYNVIGVLQGREEPDRYVMLGNHLDAWLFGSLDPSSGTAAMMELSRVFLQLYNETGWRPRRSLVFCGWGAEEYGLVGSTEWVEQFSTQLSNRVVAYLNVDMAIEGNYTLRTKAAPLLTEAIYESSKKIPNPDPEEVLAGRTTVYDTWAHRRPDPHEPHLPRMQSIGSGSDYKTLQHNLGVPCLDFRYTHDNILPFSLDVYADYISKAQLAIEEKYGQLLSSQNICLEFFTEAGVNFKKAITSFKKVINGLDRNNHVITAPSKTDAYGATAFAGLVDTLFAIEEASENDKKDLWRIFAHHLAAVTHLLNTAAKVLSDDLW